MDVGGVGEMFDCKILLNGQKYLSALETVLTSFLICTYGSTYLNGVKFQQENTYCHKSTTTMHGLRTDALYSWTGQRSPQILIESSTFGAY